MHSKAPTGEVRLYTGWWNRRLVVIKKVSLFQSRMVVCRNGGIQFAWTGMGFTDVSEAM